MPDVKNHRGLWGDFFEVFESVKSSLFQNCFAVRITNMPAYCGPANMPPPPPVMGGPICELQQARAHLFFNGF